MQLSFCVLMVKFKELIKIPSPSCSTFSPPDRSSPIQLKDNARVFELLKGKTLYKKGKQSSILVTA